MQMEPARETKTIAFLYVTFVLLALYVLQARILEMPSVHVDHYAAGACNVALILLYPLAFMICLFGLKRWSDLTTTNGNYGKFYVALALLPFLVIILVHGGFQKWAPDYEEEAYLSIVAAFEEGSDFTTDEVAEILGTPLSQEQAWGQQVWSYTYMPSTGIGWNKRLVFFDDVGKMTGYYRFNEMGPE